MSGATAGYPGGYPRGPNPGPGMGPGLSGHPEDTPARDYETPGFNHPGHAHLGFTGASGPPPSGISAPPTSSYRRWTPGSSAGGPPGGPAAGYYGAHPGPGVPHQGPGGTRPSPAGPYPGAPGPPRGVPMRGPPPEPASASGYATGAVAGYGGPRDVPGDGGPPRLGMPSGMQSGTSAPRRPPSAGAPPSYDVVHLSARNARLEEKLSKALAKNRSMAKYYDQLLAKTRDAQEREVDGLKGEIARLNARAANGNDFTNGGDIDALRDELRAEQTKRRGVERELEASRTKRDGAAASTSEAFAETAAALRVATDALAARDAELATTRESLRAARSENGTLSVGDGGEPGVAASHNSTLSQMRDLLDRAREDQRRERADAERRDAEMAKQLTEIKEQALERIRESTAAAREVATLKERCHASELERDRLRDKVQELEHDERDHRELRRMARDAEHAAKAAREKADRCELAEARLRQEQAHVASLRDERAQAHARTQEMTERLLSVTNEKDVLVRHSARQVHVEAELANAKEELASLKKQSLATRAEAKETTGVWRDGAEGLGRVLRAHIYGHARWERAVSDECSGALDAHEHAQRSTVRLVAAAEQEAAGLAGEAIEVVRATRQLLAEYKDESKAVVAEIRATVTRNADERVEAALSMLRDAETRAEAAEADSAEAQADARRARAAAARAGVLPSALAVPEADDAAPTRDSSGVVSDLLARSSANPAFRRALRERQFQMFGVALWKRATAREGTRDVSLLRGQLELARRETKVALAQAERSERLSDQRGVSTKWGLLCAGLLRASDKERRARAEDVERALETASLKLRASAGERDGAAEALRRADTEIARLVRALDALRMDHDDALRRLAHERGLRGELGMLARGQDPGVVFDAASDASEAFLDAPSVLATRRAMDALFDATTAAVALAKDAAEDARMGSDESVARDKLGETLRACHDALLVMADEDESAARLARSERERAAVGAAEPPSSARRDARNAATAMDAATRRVQRRALEVKAELVAALLDGLAARRDAAVANRLAGASTEKASAYRAENAAARVMRFARLSKERRIREGSLPGTPTKAATNADTAIPTTSDIGEATSTSRREDGRVETASDRFGSAASGYARAARAATAWSARATSARDRDRDREDREPDPSSDGAYGAAPPYAQTVSEERSSDAALRDSTDVPEDSVRLSVAAGADAFSDPDAFSSARAARRARPKVVHSPPSKAHALRETVVARGGGVSFDEDPADRSYASLVKARARRADALAARSVNDGALAETRAARGASPAGDERGKARGDAGKPATKNAKKWTPPPWDERPLRKSDKKSQGVTNPYASKPTKARVTARR